MSVFKSGDSIHEGKEDRSIIHNIKLLFAIFSVVMLTTGIISYNLAATELKTQLTNKCQALAATVATIIAEDSDGYTAFLQDMDRDTKYYSRTKALMIKLKQINVEHVTYVYTETFVDGDTKMYVIGGEHPSSPVYTGPGVTEAMTKAERIAYSTKKTALGEDFENTEYGERLSAYEPIVHKDTGEFLGLVGADIVRQQYNSIMIIFIVQTVISIIAGLTIFAFCMRWFSGNVNHVMNKQRYEAEFARNILSTGRMHYQKMNEMYDSIRMMRHDYKFHLNAALDMLRRGEIEKSSEYLIGLQAEFSEHELLNFCDNPVINSLISDYAERCKKSDIETTFKISIPDDFNIPNYDMCIIFGNLLENAMESCQKLKTNRNIQLKVKLQGEQLAIMVRNKFDGSVSMNGEERLSTKKGGGIGLRSVQAVVVRHGGKLITEHDEDWFKAFVLLRIPSSQTSNSSSGFESQ